MASVLALLTILAFIVALAISIWRLIQRQSVRVPALVAVGSLLATLIIAAIGGTALEAEREQMAAASAPIADAPAEQAIPEQTDAEKETMCRQDAQCFGKKNLTKAMTRCATAIEKQAKYSIKWMDEGLFSSIALESFHTAGVGDLEKGILYLAGDRVQFENGFGAMQRMTYECAYDAEKMKVIEISVQPVE